LIMTKFEKWIAAFEASKAGAEAIGELKEFEEPNKNIEPDDVLFLKRLILKACFRVFHYDKERDFYEIARKMDKATLTIEPLLNCLKENKVSARIKAENFLILLAERGITIHGDDSKIDQDLAEMLTLVIESIYYSKSFRSGDTHSVISNMDFSEDLANKNQRPDIRTIGLILELTLIIEKWLLLENVDSGDLLIRQSGQAPKKFLWYKVVAMFVNATLNKSYTGDQIKNKLKKHLDNNPGTSYVNPLVFD